MAYSTQTDIEKSFPLERIQETTDDVNGTTVDTDVLDEQIEFADAFIDLHLRGKHVVPLDAPVPVTVRKWSVIITIGYLYDRRIDLQIPENLQKRFDQAVKELEFVRDNKLMIDDDDSQANTAGYYKTNKTEDSRIFTVNDEETGILDQYFSKSRISPLGTTVRHP